IIPRPGSARLHWSRPDPRTRPDPGRGRLGPTQPADPTLPSLHLTEDPKQRGDIDYDLVDIKFLRDEDPMVAWVTRATTERGEYELDEKADDLEDPPRPNTFLARAVVEAIVEEEGDHGDVGQSYSPQFLADLEAEVDLLGDIELECVERTVGGGHGHDDDDDDFKRRPPTSSQLVKRKQIAKESRPKKTGVMESRSTKGIVIRKPPPPVQKKKGWLSGWGSKKGKKGATLVSDPLDIADAETLDPNAEDDTPSPLDSPRLPNSASHDSMTTGGSSSDGGGGCGGGGDTPQGGGGGDSGQGGGGGYPTFTEEQFFRGAT
ncbi:hypothetical protein Taro_031197, partial [Colocasia esculenta]|nr:hypothetical protein [Colocasia esculenta]